MIFVRPPPDRADRPALLNTFTRILWEMLVVLGERTRPAGTTPVLPVALVNLIAGRLHRLQRRFIALVEAALAGTLKPVRSRARRAAADDAAKRQRAPDSIPRAAGWLAKLCPDSQWFPYAHVGPARTRLSRLLEDATLRGLLASDPRFGRMLRPVWRMLRTEPPPACLRLPARPRRARAKRQKPDIGRPIPKGVTRADLRRSRAMTPPEVPPPVPLMQPQCRTATDWTPTHLTLGRRISVFDPIPNGGRRSQAWRRRHDESG